MQESEVQGIWTKEDAEDEKFVRFFNVIQEHARKEGCVFFSWSGEGHELVTDDMDGEDMSGWLIADSDVADFEPQWKADRNSIEDRFAKDMCVAEWSRKKDGDIAISFRFWNK